MQIKTYDDQVERAKDTIRCSALLDRVEIIKEIADDLIDTLYGGDVANEAFAELFPMDTLSMGLRIPPEWAALEAAIRDGDETEVGRIVLAKMAEARQKEAEDLYDTASEALDQEAEQDEYVRGDWLMRDRMAS